MVIIAFQFIYQCISEFYWIIHFNNKNKILKTSQAFFFLNVFIYFFLFYIPTSNLFFPYIRALKSCLFKSFESKRKRFIALYSFHFLTVKKKLHCRDCSWERVKTMISPAFSTVWNSELFCYQRTICSYFGEGFIPFPRTSLGSQYIWKRLL